MTARRAVIVGAGPAGLAAALALRATGWDVAVHERRPGPGGAGSGLTLWPNGLAALATFGADEPVRDRALTAPGTAMHTADGRVLNAMTGTDLDAAGGRGIALSRAALLAALDGPVTYGAACVGVRTGPTGAAAVFADGTEAHGDLVIGADGLRSVVRAACGLPTRLRYAGFVVWRAVVAYPLPPTPGLLTLGGPDQFGVWGLPDGRVYWFAATPAAEHDRPPRPPASFGRWHEPIPALLAATPDDAITVTGIYDRRPLPRWGRGRVVLIGDAAHPSLPTMGQGTSQAFEDVAVLADRLAAVPDVRTALIEYERLRRPRARSAWAQARTMARMGCWRNPVACRFRDTLMTTVPERARRGQLARLFAFRLR